MANSHGHAASLEPYREGNTHSVQHGLYSSSGRILAPRAREIADALMEAAHTVPLDRLAAEEIGALLARIEALDAELDRRGPGGRGVATLLDLRLRASGRLERWLREFGATPATRADWAARLGQGGLAEEIRRRRAELRGKEEPGA